MLPPCCVAVNNLLTGALQGPTLGLITKLTRLESLTIRWALLLPSWQL
jgi:hypothetical protein